MRSPIRLDSIFPGPFFCCGLVPVSVGLVDMGDFWNERVIGVGVREHGANGKQD